MSLLDMIPERDRAELRRNLFASEEFFSAVRIAVYGLKQSETDCPHLLMDNHLDRAFERHGFAPSNPEHAAALRESLAEIERVIAELEKTAATANVMPRPFQWAPEVRALAEPLRSAVERLRGLK